MKNKIKSKKFDSVKLMREIRNKLSNDYIKHPEKEEKDLIRIRQKYGIKGKVKDTS
ncbi:MAG: hypothetical protein R6V04_08250 [bacterium]